jgi:hypothetical protein
VRPSDQDIKKDHDGAYGEADSYWADYLRDAKETLQYYHGKQFTSAEERQFTLQGRLPLKWNFLKRIARTITGYERRNRMLIKVVGRGEDDDKAASQHTQVLDHIMGQQEGYPWMVLSDAFKWGPVITGINLVAFWPDQRGDFHFGRHAYDRFRIDPNFESLDLSDARYILIRKKITRGQALRLLPEGTEIPDEADLKMETDGKFSDIPTRPELFGEKTHPYDEFWRIIDVPVKMIVSGTTQIPYDKALEKAKLQGYTPKQFDDMLKDDQRVDTMTVQRPTNQLAVIYGGHVCWYGTKVYGLDEYPFVPMIGDYCPEEPDSKLRMQSVLTVAKDPQKADNRRLMHILHILETAAYNQRAFREGSVVDEDDMLKSGAGAPPIAMSRDSNPQSDIRTLENQGVPPGMLELHQMFQQMTFDVPGIHQELYENQGKDIPALLFKLRQGEALTVQQDIFDNYRYAKCLLGGKLVRAVQARMTPQKVQSVLHEQPSPDFYDPDYTRFHCILTEGLLTDNQRQSAFAELWGLRQGGVTIPDWIILKFAPIPLKDELRQALAQGEQRQQQAAQVQQTEEMLTQKTKQAKIVSDLTRADQQSATAMMTRVETAQEIKGMQYDRLMGLIDRLMQLEQMGRRNAMTTR